MPLLPSSPVAVQVSPMALEVGVPAATSTIGSGGMSSGSAMAKKAFSRPPLTVIPSMEGMSSAEVMMMFFICDTGTPGETARTSAATPATCGVAIEVPDFRP